MKHCTIGGQAVMEGVMMRSPDGTALAVRQADGKIVTEYYKAPAPRKKGSFPTWPVVRGVYAFIDSISTGMKITTRSAELVGGEVEEPSKFEVWLSKKLGKSAMDVATGMAGVLGILLAAGLFVALPTFLARLIPYTGTSTANAVWESLAQGFIRLAIFIGYLFAVSAVKDIRRVFMYHGAEHKTIACYEHDAELTPENAMQYTRLHARCGTNYLFLVMAVSILFFAVVNAVLKIIWADVPFLVAFVIRLLFIPVVAGIAYEILKGAARSDNLVCRIVRAPGLALQRITTREPEKDMLEVAITAFNLCMNPPRRADAFPSDKGDKGFSAAFSDDEPTVPAPDAEQTEEAASDAETPEE